VRSRALNKKIDIYQTSTATDSYGGDTVSSTLISSSWAKLSSLSSRSVVDFGLDYTTNAVQVTTRFREDLPYNSSTLYFMYRGEKYRIETFPINDDFKDGFISFIGVKEKPSTNTELTAI
jgi:SPP1 family predicted phage head-tail adaptor